jgi:sugar phosphate isomerase/epimerase
MPGEHTIDISTWEGEGGNGRSRELQEEAVRRERDVQDAMAKLLETEKKAIMGPGPCVKDPFPDFEGRFPPPKFPSEEEELERMTEALNKLREEARARQAAFLALEQHVVEIDSDKKSWPIQRIVDVVLDAYAEALKV